MKNQPENLSVFEDFVQRVMQAEAAVGLAVSVVEAGGAVLYEKCFGWRDEEARLPMDGDTLVGIASISKSFTALAVMQLYERGVIDIEKPVCTYIPLFGRKEVLVRHLLCHSAGFYPMRRKAVQDTLDKMPAPPQDPFASVEAAELGLAELLDDFDAQTRLAGKPGESFSYSNDSFALLSEIVRLYGGEPTFAQYVQKNILDPLDMSDSCVSLHCTGVNAAKLYQMREGKMAGDWTMLDDQQPHAGAGGVKSTLNDMKKYALMYLNEGRGENGAHILSSAGVREMIRPRIACDLNGYYGYGLYSQAYHTLTVYGHGGDQPGVAARLMWSYESGVAVIVLCNTAGVSSSAIAGMAMQLASGCGYTEPMSGFEPMEWDSEAMDAVCGEYLSGEGTHVVIARDGSAFNVSIDGAATTAFPVNRYMLRVRRLIEDMLVRIYRDENGEVYALGGGYRMIPKIK